MNAIDFALFVFLFCIPATGIVYGTVRGVVWLFTRNKPKPPRCCDDGIFCVCSRPI